MLDGAILESGMPFPRAQIRDTTRRRPKRCSRARDPATLGVPRALPDTIGAKKKLRPFVETIRARAEQDGDERLAQLAERFLR